MKRVLLAMLILLLILTTACASVPASHPPLEQSLDVAWTCTTEDKLWLDCEAVQLIPGTAPDADFDINTYDLGQEVTGFGGAFNEKGWVALSVLTPEERDAVIKAMFDPKEGAKFNLCRVPIGASDYAMSRYTLNETEGDYDMNSFSIERDKENLLPYIQAAMAYRPDLKIWGSAWTPPTWMKTNSDFDGGYMKDDPKTYEAYALYLARFVEAYQAEGINLFAVAVQNEPGIDRHYPTCLWEPEQFQTFIKDYMGPLFEERGVNADIMLGTFEDGDFRNFPNLLSDPNVNKYVSLVGFQWGGVYAVAHTREYFPDKQIYQTETECGNFYDREGYNPNRPPNDWAYGIYTWNKVKQYFDEGVNAYLLWNMVLDEEGKSIDSENPWPQNAAITVDKNTREVTYTPMFYAFKHFSYYIKPGAQYVNNIGDGGDGIAFLNPDGNLVIELQNPNDEPRTMTINVDGGVMTVDLPEMSWNTLIVPSH